MTLGGCARRALAGILLSRPGAAARRLSQLGGSTGCSACGDDGRMRPLAMMRGTARIIAAVRNKNAAAGETAVHKMPARALAARLAPAWTVASSPNAEPRRVAGASRARARRSGRARRPGRCQFRRCIPS